MKVYLLEHHSTPYPVVGYGGGERVNNLLFNTLTTLGFDVTLIIHDKTVFSQGCKVIQLPYAEIENLWNGKVPLSKYVDKDCDIFHSHTAGKTCNFDFTGLKCKWSSTCHGEYEDVLSPYQIYLTRNHLAFHIQKYGVDKIAKGLFVCNNGIDTDNIFPVDGPHDRIVWFGNICQSKGCHLLPFISEMQKEKILMAGVIGDDGYFNQYIKPYLGEKLEFIGSLNTDEDKRNFLSRARVYLHMSTNQEPFGLTTVEAQACGVPAITFNCGGTPEIVFDKFLIVNDPPHMSLAIRDLPQKKIDPQTLRNWTIRKFSGVTMACEYIKTWNLITKI